MAERTLRVFVSSPSDVAAERARVKVVADRLNAQLEGVVRLDVLRWEDAFYTAAQSFPQAIDAAIGNMSATDMVLCIVWKRAGLKLDPSTWRRTDGPPYESGTVLEFETAVEVSRKHNGVPDVYLFRKSAPVVYEAERVTEQLEQSQLLQAVWKRWTENTEGYNTAGHQSFADPDDFEIKLEACLRQWLERRGVVAKGPVWDRAVKGSPFRGLAAFEAAHSSVFFGREQAIATLNLLPPTQAELEERFGEDLPAPMRAFIASSLDADFRRRAAERSRARRVLAATAAGLIGAVVLAGLAGWQWRLADEQKTIADAERARAEAALTAAAKTADTLIFDLAQDLRNRTGMPLDLVRLILERVQNLERQLVQAGDRTPELISLEAAALDELASLYLDQGDPAAALAVSERARDVLQKMIEALPNFLWVRRDAAIAWNKIGDAKLATSDARGALEAYKAALALMGPLAEGNPSEASFQRAFALSLNKVADALAFLGQREEALANYGKSITIVQNLTASDTTNVLWQSDLAFTQTRIGMLLASAGMRDEALAAFNNATAIREALAEKEPQASNRKRDVFNSLINLGGLLVTMGRRADALAAYRKALNIITSLSATDPGNLQWQRDTATITSQIGSVLAGDGAHADALDHFRRSLAISEKLVAANPGNLMWLRDVAVVENQIGDVLSLLRRGEEALVAYRASLIIAEHLVDGNPQASEWERDLAISLVKVADAIVTNNRAEAHGYYERSRAIREKLAAADPDNLTAQRDVSLVYDRIGNALLSESRDEEALDMFRKGLAIRERIVRLDPRNVITKREIGFSHDRIATTLQALGRVDDARAQFRARLLVIEDYAATDPSNAVWQIDLVLCLNSLGQIGDEPRARYERILKMLRNLEREKKLTPEQSSWIAAAERFLATLPR
ncbi:MAG: tetratricopeptide repeat protein [Microvirga sp.]